MTHDALVSCVIVALLVLLIALELFRKGSPTMADKSSIETLRDGSAIVIVNVIAKSGYRGGFTFRNVTPDTWTKVLQLLDVPLHGPSEMIGNGTAIDADESPTIPGSFSK